MEMKFAQCVNKGMQRDYAMNTASQEFAYENKNIRITTSGNESFLSITNEKSTEEVFGTNKTYYLTFNRIKFINGWIHSTYPVKSDIKINLYVKGYYDDSTTPYTVFECWLLEGNTMAELSGDGWTYDDIQDNYVLGGFAVQEEYRRDFTYYYLSYNYTKVEHGGENTTYTESIVPEYADPSLLEISIDGTIIGATTINNYLILFIHSSNGDIIYRVTLNPEFKIEEVYFGDLELDNDHPIECITSYESEDVQKVYWVDGKNQPRMINIAKLGQTYADTNVDFIPSFDSDIKVDVVKEYDGAGSFPSGVIQYYITYYNKFGQQTNVVHSTPIYSISPYDRGGKEDETQTCSFEITIENVDSKYDYIRVYSLIRTTKDATPSVSIVGDLNIKKEEEYKNYTYKIIDTNIGHINVPPSDILFLGGNAIIASTIEQKDNTLFLGNIVNKVNTDDNDAIKNILDAERNDLSDADLFFNRPVQSKSSTNEDYGYLPNMDASSKDRGFKYLEWYRIGLQLQNELGEWGSVFWIGDIQNKDCFPNKEYDGDDEYIKSLYDVEYDYTTVSGIRYAPSDDLVEALEKTKNKKYRLVMAEHNPNTRTIKTQGIVMPSVFNLKQRSDKTCFGSPLWSTGIVLNPNHKHLTNVDLIYESIGNTATQIVYPTQHLDTTLYNLGDIEGLSDGTNITGGEVKPEIEFKLQPSSAFKTSPTQGDKSYYLSKIDIYICVIRDSPNFIKFNATIPGNISPFRDKAKYLDSPHGNGVIQDVFGVFITPYKIDFDSQEETKMKSYFHAEYRLAGKRKNTFSYLLTYINSLTWGDYFEGAGESEKDILGIDTSAIICSALELPSAEQLRDASGAGRDYGEPGGGYHNTLYRNGSGISKKSSLVDSHGNEYFIDANVCNLWSPNIKDLSNSFLNFRIVGEVNISNTISNYQVNMENNVIGGKAYDVLEGNFNRYTVPLGDDININTGITAFPMWPGVSTQALIWIHTWNQNTVNKDSTVPYETKIKTKTFGNLWKCDTQYIDSIEYNRIQYTLADNDSLYVKNYIYQNKHQNVLFPKNLRRLFLYRKDGLGSTTDITTINKLIKNNQNGIFAKTDSINDSVNIKYSSTDHLILDLDKKAGLLDVLPNYTRNDSLNATLYDGTPYNLVPDYEVQGVLSIDREIFEEGTYDCTVQTTSYYYPNTSTGYANYKITIGDNPEEFFVYADVSYGYTIYEFITNRLYSTRNGSDVYILEFSNMEKFSEYDRITKGTLTVKILQVGEVVKYPTQISGDTVYGVVVKDDDGNYIQNYNQSGSFLGLSYERESPNKNSKLFIGELYTEHDPLSFMGGTSENALELNTFIPISDAFNIGETIYALEGDTYYQQWDCLRTYPTSEDDVNKIVDVVSVPLETNINLDGDTRPTRGRSDVYNIRPANIVDTINTVYSQSNNYTTGFILDSKFDTSKHLTQYWWSLMKTPNSDIDTWTQVNLTSIAELDGDKGPLNKIKRWNNSLFAFQDRAIALINFNNQTTLSTQEGVPVQIANSGKVQGHYYITTNNGCKNKWSIVESPNGLYFIDGYNKSINILGDGIKSLSMNNLFQDWIEQNELGNIWSLNYSDVQAFKSFYDPIHKEVYFANGKDCLCYNELLEQFTSFYDYEKMEHLLVLENSVYGISEGIVYRMFEGEDYCNLFGIQRDYYMQYKINNEPFIDKTWTNLEYRADIFDRGNIQTNEFATNNIILNKTFDTLKVWNEYQQGELDLNKVRFNYIKEAKPRFRIWKTNMPRAEKTDTNKYGLDRIRNPWIMLELKKTNDTNKRMEFHDLIIKYVI